MDYFRFPKRNFYNDPNIILCNKYNIFDTNILSRGYSTKFQGVEGYDKHPLQCKMEIPGGGGGGSNLKVPYVGVWIFSGTTQ